MTSAAAKIAVAPDPTFYPVTDEMGESTLHLLIRHLLLAQVRRWMTMEGKPDFVGSDQFFYWKQHHPNVCVAPDLYILPGVGPSPDIGCWKLWEAGRAPTLAVEIVSRDYEKDYVLSPRRYEDLGVRELVIFDPDHHDSTDRVRFQVFRRLKGRGLTRVENTNGDRVRSRVLGCFLRVVGEGAEQRVRVATGPTGDDLLPTDDERIAQADVERAALVQAEAEIARLRAELAKRGG